MADWNADKRTLTLKLVFYGPALSGKTTNLIALHDILQPELKGDMQILETKNDRTLFFDLLPLGIRTADGSLIKIKLFTVPGQVEHNSTRKAVLSRCDGIVFVADSQNNQTENNAESFNNLAQNAKVVGIDIQSIPMVVQFNKRDLQDIVSQEELTERWSQSPWQLYFASALQQQGVKETLSALLRRVYQANEEEYQLRQTHNLDEQSFVEQIIGGEN